MKSYLNKQIWFQKLNDSTKAILSEKTTIKKYKKGELIFSQQQDVKELYIILSGYVSVYKTNYHGDRRAILVFGSGECINEEIIAHHRSSVSVEVLKTNTIILVIPIALLESRMLEDVAFVSYLYNASVKKTLRLYHQSSNHSSAFNLDRQVAARIWKLGRDCGIETEEGVLIDFPLSVTFISECVGSKRESVSRSVKKLKEHQILITMRDKFLITDMDRLKDAVHDRL